MVGVSKAFQANKQVLKDIYYPFLWCQDWYYRFERFR